MARCLVGRKMMKKVLISILFLGVFMLTNAAAENDFTNADKSIMVSRAQPVIVLHLKANPSTGYGWFWSRDANVSTLIAPISMHYVAPKTAVPGQSGMDVWQFRLDQAAFVVPQVLEIKMLYKRPWEKQVAETKVFQIVTH